MEITEHVNLYAVTAVLLFFGILEFATGMYGRIKRRRDDWFIDVISLTQFAFLIKPAILFTTAFLAIKLVPQYAGALDGMNFFWALLLVAIPDDLLHYWYHRLAHEHDWLWPWHRTHHTTPSYHISISFRENWLWLTFMPGMWWGALMVYLGLEEAFIVNTAIVGVHNVWLHNGLDFDQKLYRVPIIGTLFHWSEYLINSPSLHRGHHGLGENGVPFGNYGQLLSIWDVIFGTVEFNKDKRPEYYDTIKESLDSWQSQLWWPFVKSSRPGSDIGTRKAKAMEAPLTMAPTADETS